VAHIWKERLTTLGTANLIPHEMALVRVVSFTFRFTTTKQLRDCIEYYEQKAHSTSRISAKTITADIGPDWRELRSCEVERWFERLPMYLLEELKRQKVLSALHKTLSLVLAQPRVPNIYGCCDAGGTSFQPFMAALTTLSFCSLPSAVNRWARFLSIRKRITSPISIFLFPPHSLAERM
jgi:hypothetical protein